MEKLNLQIGSEKEPESGVKNLLTVLSLIGAQDFARFACWCNRAAGRDPWRRGGSEMCSCRVSFLCRVSLFLLLLFFFLFFLMSFYFGSHRLGEVLDAENKALTAHNSY